MVTVIVIIGIAIIIICVAIKNSGSSKQATLVFIGRDYKGRPVFQNRNPNGTGPMWKLIENGNIEMNISHFNADRGTACFTPDENFLRYLVSLEKGLKQAKDSNGNFERNSQGFVIYKDKNGNYVDNPYEYYP